MISSRYYGLIRLHLVLKLLGGFAIFWGLVLILHYFFYKDRLSPENYVVISLLIPASAFLELAVREKKARSLCGLPRSRVWSITQREILFSLVGIFGAIVLSKDPSVSRVFLGCFVVFYSLWIAWMNQVGHRRLQRRLFKPSRSDRPNTVVVASPEEIEKGTAMHMTNSLPGADVLGYIPYGGAAVLDIPSFPMLGDFIHLKQICRAYRARMLLALGLDEKDPSLIFTLQQICDSLGMRLIWVEDKKKNFRGNLDSHQSGSQLLLTNWQEPLEDPVNRALKRAFDIVVSGTVALTVMPFLCAAVWMMHRIFSPGPLFYKQKRTGRDGEIFEMLKFRSMHVNDTPATQATVSDPRIFRGGHLIRKTSLDEIPQFLNVLKGEMSVVGPRPHYIDHDEMFSEIIGDYPVRQFAKPGITGLAQVKGLRGETDTEQKIKQRVRLDHFYLRNWSPMMDICIVCETAVQVVFPPRSAR